MGKTYGIGGVPERGATFVGQDGEEEEFSDEDLYQEEKTFK